MRASSRTWVVCGGRYRERTVPDRGGLASSRRLSNDTRRPVIDIQKMMVGLAIAVVTIGAVALSARFTSDSRSYREAIQRDARPRRFPADSIRYPVHWPLDVYLGLKNRRLGPESTEVLVNNADSVAYFVDTDSGAQVPRTLTQVFYFSVGHRTNAVQFMFREGGVFGVDGSDWLPLAKYRRSRHDALFWYATGLQRK